MDEKQTRKLVYFDSRVEEHWSGDRIELDGILDVCAEINTLPTAVNSLSGFQTYTNGRWGNRAQHRPPRWHQANPVFRRRRLLRPDLSSF